MKYPSIVVLTLVLLFLTASAAVWYVHPDSTMNCIDDCLDSCAVGDTVLVGAGTYLENIMWPATNGIDLISEYGPDTTIIDGDSNGRVININTLVDSTTSIMGFTIQNGFAYEGGGIACYNQASPTISNNVITDNRATYGGGGIECNNFSSPIITNNTFSDNTCPYGGAIECASNSSPTIRDNIITDNTADTTDINPLGAGILCYDYSAPDITNNTIHMNKSFYAAGGIMCHTSSNAFISGNDITGNIADSLGGGIACYLSSPTITDNTITGNTCETVGAGIVCRTSSPTIEYCTIANNNGDGVYCDIASGPNINHNNITDNVGYGVLNIYAGVSVNAENNWWGDSTGPYHPTANPGGLGDTVSDYVDFDPWLLSPGIEEIKTTKLLSITLQIHPNPFTNRTQIRFAIHDSRFTIGNTELSIYDASGRMIKSFNEQSSIENQESEVVWDGTDDMNRRVGSGVYFVTLYTDDHSEARKVLLIR